MIIVSGIKLPYNTPEQEAVDQALQTIQVGRLSVKSAYIHKKSIDARKGGLFRVYSVAIEVELGVDKLQRLLQQPQIKLMAPVLSIEPTGERAMAARPIVVGFGPAGMFAALVLAEHGYCPIVLERGQAMAQRDQSVSHFFATGNLDTQSNIQFGEGGAGTYSDGKLTTRTHDPRGQLITNYLVQHGAPPEIVSEAKPHIGTDLLKNIVVSIRNRIEACGGQVLFNTCVTDLSITHGKVKQVKTTQGDFAAETVILAVGHSARELYELMDKKSIALLPKSFAVGVRIEHLQKTIDRGLYGEYCDTYDLPAGEYALANTQNDRGCYTFCMCPGGQVVAAASEAGGVVTNGMSYHARNGVNANSAVVVSVKESDFTQNTPLDGMYFQRDLEQKAFALGGGNYVAPVQLFGDFLQGRKSQKLGEVEPTYSRGYSFENLNNILPSFICEHMQSSIGLFGKKLKGFDNPSSVLTGVETRTSAPVRIVRGDDMMSINTQGLYPCGEGAGYAGGIMSAAVDGIKVAQEIMKCFRSMQ